jgi:hypothetical protein
VERGLIYDTEEKNIRVVFKVLGRPPYFIVLVETLPQLQRHAQVALEAANVEDMVVQEYQDCKVLDSHGVMAQDHASIGRTAQHISMHGEELDPTTEVVRGVCLSPNIHF